MGTGFKEQRYYSSLPEIAQAHGGAVLHVSVDFFSTRTAIPFLKKGIDSYLAIAALIGKGINGESTSFAPDAITAFFSD